MAPKIVLKEEKHRLCDDPSDGRMLLKYIECNEWRPLFSTFVLTRSSESVNEHYSLLALPKNPQPRTQVIAEDHMLADSLRRHRPKFR